MKISIKFKDAGETVKVAPKPKPKTPKKTQTKTTKKTTITAPAFKKPGQKKKTPAVTDSLYKFYSSLYKQNPKSEMATKWLIEHGCLEDDEVIGIQMAAMAI